MDNPRTIISRREAGLLNGKQAAKTATGIAGGMTVYLRGIPEKLYALFGTGYLDSRRAGALRGLASTAKTGARAL